MGVPEGDYRIGLNKYSKTAETPLNLAKYVDLQIQAVE